MQNIYARKRTHTGDMTQGSLRWRVHTECQSMQREEGKGGAVYLGHVAV